MKPQLRFATGHSLRMEKVNQKDDLKKGGLMLTYHGKSKTPTELGFMSLSPTKIHRNLFSKGGEIHGDESQKITIC